MSWNDIQTWLKERGVKVRFLKILLERSGVYTTESALRTAMSSGGNENLRRGAEFVINKFDKLNGYAD